MPIAVGINQVAAVATRQVGHVSISVSAIVERATYSAKWCAGLGEDTRSRVEVDLGGTHFMHIQQIQVSICGSEAKRSSER